MIGWSSCQDPCSTVGIVNSMPVAVGTESLTDRSLDEAARTQYNRHVPKSQGRILRASPRVMTPARGFTKRIKKSRVVANACACNSSTGEAEAGKSRVHGRLWLHSESEANLGYMRPCLKQSKTTTKNSNTKKGKKKGFGQNLDFHGSQPRLKTHKHTEHNAFLTRHISAMDSYPHSRMKQEADIQVTILLLGLLAEIQRDRTAMFTLPCPLHVLRSSLLC